MSMSFPSHSHLSCKSAEDVAIEDCLSTRPNSEAGRASRRCLSYRDSPILHVIEEHVDLLVGRRANQAVCGSHPVVPHVEGLLCPNDHYYPRREAGQFDRYSQTEAADHLLPMLVCHLAGDYAAKVLDAIPFWSGDVV